MRPGGIRTSIETAVVGGKMTGRRTSWLDHLWGGGGSGFHIITVICELFSPPPLPGKGPCSV